MIGNHHYSTWGLKDSGEDITNDIIDIATNATSFIVAAGYNFSFRHAGMMFFNELTHKANNGIPVILIVPPHLAGQYNPQPKLINYCIANNIGVILNKSNHSKWLLTENDLYYGSSNFTPTSWRDRVEVVTIHRHRKIFMNWKRATILDFRLFIQREIADINNKRRNMHLYPGLIPLTVNTWNNIKPLIRRLNPSIEKVKETLENYETVELSLYFVIEQWFIQANQEGIEIIYSMSYEILEIINNICEYAYANIYNESIKNDEIQNKEVIDNYNNLHDKFIEVIDQQILTVEKLGNMKQRRSGLYEKNVGLINVLSERLSINGS
ncbi:MAG: phospholipase D-like domain-containing protein [Chitinophagales bacterium]|jgi:hypothetical protein